MQSRNPSLRASKSPSLRSQSRPFPLISILLIPPILPALQILCIQSSKDPSIPKPPSSKPPSLQWPRRDARSVNNPPAHPKDERRRAGPMPTNSSLKSLLTGVRVSRRGKRLPDFFFIIFFASKLSTRNPTQGLPKGHPRDPQITRISTFCYKSRPRDPIFIDFLVDLCFSHFLTRFLVRFS